MRRQDEGILIARSVIAFTVAIVLVTEVVATITKPNSKGSNCSNIDNPSKELLVSAQMGYETEVKVLLKCKGIDINIAGNVLDLYRTPLMCAAQGGHLEVAKLLLGHEDIEVNKVISDEEHATGLGRTALWYASELGNTELVKQLLTHYQVDVNVVDVNNRGALYIAVHNGHTEVVGLLIAHPHTNVNKLEDPELFPNYIYEPKVKFSTACWIMDCELACMTTIWLASLMGYFDIVKLLLDHPNIMVTKGIKVDREAMMY